MSTRAGRRRRGVSDDARTQRESLPGHSVTGALIVIPAKVIKRPPTSRHPAKVITRLLHESSSRKSDNASTHELSSRKSDNASTHELSSRKSGNASTPRVVIPAKAGIHFDVVPHQHGFPPSRE